MKCLPLAICLIYTVSYSQTVQIREIKCRPNSRFYNTKETTIVYPIIATKNPVADKSINDRIMNEVLPSDEDKKNVRKRLDESINDGLSDLSYEVTFNKNNIFSLNISSQNCRAHLTYSQTYFNFDTRTGEAISISDLISEAKIDSFRQKVYQDKITFLKQYKIESLEQFAKHEIDSTTYEWAMQEVDSNCLNNAEIGTFSLSDSCLEVIDPCGFPNAIRGMEPTYELKYPYKVIRWFIKPEFQKRVTKEGRRK